MCKKSVVDPRTFEAHFDMQIKMTKMPEDYKDTKMVVLCNDCLTKSLVPFHIYGGKCKKCRSYNTTRCDDDAELKRFIEEQKKEDEEKAKKEAANGNQMDSPENPSPEE